MGKEFDAEGLLGFSGEAVLYCQGISDTLAREYAMDYARMLLNRAKGMEAQEPRSPAGLFGPSRDLIRSTLNRMYVKYLCISQDTRLNCKNWSR